MGIQRQRLKELLLLGEPAFEFRENVGGQGESKERKETGFCFPLLFVQGLELCVSVALYASSLDPKGGRQKAGGERASQERKRMKSEMSQRPSSFNFFVSSSSRRYFFTLLSLSFRLP